ncbi:hypothetical protein SAMN04487895_110180 [Paenibacillus sophorae]|uniref:Uncharacterized protein n=1 Tax=Paenibacillus sophorae TaxID=1333845 RepID=A0A1H8S004_9BACL|nr:hypothetical protein [Paenibacillus sophorae]QWU16908.1 hypothetical protein KP014_06820 [Paenibacillus sophorae]SEO71698.1 hypothetical protein SAMN04487895_110180 [Paenibacillus sophorae]
MGRKKEQDAEYSAEGGTSRVSGSGVCDWGGSDGFSLSDSAAGTHGERMKERQAERETGDIS